MKDDFNICGVIDLTCVKLEILLNQAPKSIDFNVNALMNGFRLSRNQKGIDFFTEDDELFKSWKKSFKLQNNPDYLP